MDKRLVYTKVKTFNNSFKKEEYKKVPCSEGENNLNEPGDKTFVFEFDKMLAYLHDSLYMEQFVIKDTVDEITLENDHLMAKYSSAKTMFGSEDVESITQAVGEASTIIQSVTTSEAYKKTYGGLSGWFPDDGDTPDKDNKGFIARKEYYNGKTTITMFYPLRFLLGIFSDYPKVFYNIPKLTLILNRKSEDAIIKRIFYGSKLKAATAPATGDVKPSYITKKLQWWIPALTPNLSANTLFHSQLSNNANVDMGFMKHRMVKESFQVENYTWKIAEASRHVRFIFIAFKTETEDAKKNNNLFTLKAIRKVQVSVNGEDYPAINIEVEDGDIGEAYLSYIKACEYFGVEPQFNIHHYGKYQPILCFNTTSQLETLEGNSVSILIEKEGTDQIYSYCLMKEETHLRVNLKDHTVTKLAMNSKKE